MLILEEILVALVYLFLPLILGWGYVKLSGSTKPKKEIFLLFYLFISVGIQGLSTGFFQIVKPELVEGYTQWPFSRYLAELGMANLGFGILGILSLWQDNGWQRATAIGYGLFLLFTGLGHLYSIYHTGISPGDFGGFLLSDLFVPVALFSLLP